MIHDLRVQNTCFYVGVIIFSVRNTSSMIIKLSTVSIYMASSSYFIQVGCDASARYTDIVAGVYNQFFTTIKEQILSKAPIYQSFQ